MLQSMISKTKKKLSKNSWLWPTVILALTSILFIVGAIIQILPRRLDERGVVNLNIPVMHVTKKLTLSDDPYQKKERQISEQTTTILLTETGDFIFGELDAFGKDYHLQRNKFYIEQENGQPQLGNLIRTMEAWYKNKKGKKPAANDLAILIPASQVPLAVVTQVVAGLKKGTDIKHIVLGNGLN